MMQGEINGLKTELHNKDVVEGTYDNHTTTYDETVREIITKRRGVKRTSLGKEDQKYSLI